MTTPIPDAIGLSLSTSVTTLFHVPAGTKRHILQVQVCNVDGANDADVTVQWVDASNGYRATRLAYQVTVAAGDARTMLAGPLVLSPSDSMQAYASATGDLDITVTYYDEAV